VYEGGRDFQCCSFGAYDVFPSIVVTSIRNGVNTYKSHVQSTVKWRVRLMQAMLVELKLDNIYNMLLTYNKLIYGN
jgi:hypothetical protein